jgi:hypothetical protein
MTVAADRDLRGAARRCPACGFATAERATACPVCGATMEEQPLVELLPLLARRNHARLQLVGGPAADALRPHGGLGAVLRFIPEAPKTPEA